MKIALFSETYLPQINGVATHVKTLKEGLEALGHQVLVVTADSNVSSHRIEEGILRCPAVEMKSLYGYGLASSYNLERMHLLRQFSPDIVHAHTEFSIGSTGLELSRELHIPFIYTLHTMWDEYLHYVASPALMPTVRKMAHRYFGYFANQADSIIGPSQKVQNFLNSCGVHKTVNIISNAVELDKFSPEQISDTCRTALRQTYGLSDDNLVLGFCGRLAQEKSVDKLLDYFAVCHEADKGIRLMLIGDGPARSDLEAQVLRLHLKDAVIFTGAVPHNSMKDAYSCCDLYVTASRSEVNSISMLEAMSMGLPVLHIMDEANLGQVVNGINGYIFHNAAELCGLVLDYRNSSETEKQRLRSSVTASVHSSSQVEMAQKAVDIYLRHMKSKVIVLPQMRKEGVK